VLAKDPYLGKTSSRCTTGVPEDKASLVYSPISWTHNHYKGDSPDSGLPARPISDVLGIGGSSASSGPLMEARDSDLGEMADMATVLDQTFDTRNEAESAQAAVKGSILIIGGLIVIPWVAVFEPLTNIMARTGDYNVSWVEGGVALALLGDFLRYRSTVG